jgi:hypothetical protein
MNYFINSQRAREMSTHMVRFIDKLFGHVSTMSTFGMISSKVQCNNRSHCPQSWLKCQSGNDWLNIMFLALIFKFSNSTCHRRYDSSEECRSSIVSDQYLSYHYPKIIFIRNWCALIDFCRKCAATDTFISCLLRRVTMTSYVIIRINLFKQSSE